MEENEKVKNDEFDKLVNLTANIASAYVGNNNVAVGDMENLITSIYVGLNSLSAISGAGANKQAPAVAVAKSISQDYIICLEDGKKFKSLKRHLRTHYNLSPEEYREKWGLPMDYPMVAPNYAAARSRLAKNMGLGHKGRRKAVQS
ncbi:MAG: MucR family transcriptional regulator [Rhizobiales bacterium]|nr:MucR family transcriptional regulator [Hyphomicrobiales bacterium]NRB13411.1 MucR family transcriptional regulator [Hyphomicrobiales bacterium]